MIETIIAIILLIVAFFTGNPLWAIAAGLFILAVCVWWCGR